MAEKNHEQVKNPTKKLRVDPIPDAMRHFSMEDHLSDAIIQLILFHPFYGLLLSNINKTFSSQIGTACVYHDGASFQMLFNEEFFTDLLYDEDGKINKTGNMYDGVTQRMGLIVHELLHVTLRHLSRQADFADKKLFNIAADLVINQIVAELGDNYLPKGGLTLDRYKDFNLEEHKNVEYYYSTLRERLDEANKGAEQQMQQMQSGGQGSGDSSDQSNQQSDSDSDGNSNSDSDGDDGGNGNGQQPLSSGLTESHDNLLNDHANGNTLDDHGQWGKIPKEVREMIDDEADQMVRGAAEQYESQGNDCGKLPAWAKQRIADMKKKPSLNWKTDLRQFTATSKSRFLAVPKRNRFSRRFEEVTPRVMIKPESNVLVVFDTSGSVSDYEISMFFAEIDHATRSKEVWLMEFDHVVSAEPRRYTRKTPKTITGRGGTCFDTPMKFINENARRFDSVVFFTDGYAPAPRKCKLPLLWVITPSGADLDPKEYGGRVVKMIP